MPKEIAYRLQTHVKQNKNSKMAQYIQLIIGKPGIWTFLKYELIILLSSNLPGALGLFLRSKLYPLLLKKCGKGVVFGSGVVLRHPHKIEIGDHVIIDDHCLLDAKGENNVGIKIGNGVFLGRNSILSCKDGDIFLGDEVNIGFNCEIFSGSCVHIEENALIAAYCYFMGGDHQFKDIDKTISEQESPSYGIRVGKNGWFGAGAKIQDGVTIGEHCIIGTSAVVTKDIPPYKISHGIPAKIVKDRRDKTN